MLSIIRRSITSHIARRREDRQYTNNDVKAQNHKEKVTTLNLGWYIDLKDTLSTQDSPQAWT